MIGKTATYGSPDGSSESNDASRVPLRSDDRKLVWLATLLFTGLHWISRARSLWDWDEALFCLSLRDFDISLHHPHPPGFPIFVVFAKAIHSVGVEPFASFQFITFLGAAALLPLAFCVGREMGMKVNTALISGAVLSAMPTVMLYGGSAFSDVPSLAFSLGAVALLLRGRSSQRAFLLGSFVLAISAGLRIQNLLIGFVPAVLATIPRVRTHKGQVLAAAALGLAVLAACYGGAIVATGSAEAYFAAVRAHATYLRDVDSWANPNRPALSYLWEKTAVRPWRGGDLAGVVAWFALFALADGLVHKNKSSRLVVFTFAPFMLFAWFMLDWISMSRLSIGYLPLHAFLCAIGVAIVGKMLSTWLPYSNAKCTVTIGIIVVVALLGRSIEVVKAMRTTTSPPVRAFEWIKRNYNPGVTKLITVQGSTNAFADLLLPEFANIPVASEQDVPLQIARGDALFIVEGVRDNARATFKRDRRGFKGLIRDRYFAISVVPLEDSIVYLGGWYEPEGAGSTQWRWMGSRSELLLGASARPRRVRLSLELPSETVGMADVTVRCAGGDSETLHPTTASFLYECAVLEGSEPRSISIEVSATVTPSQLNDTSTDRRQLGLRLVAMELR